MQQDTLVALIGAMGVTAASIVSAVGFAVVRKLESVHQAVNYRKTPDERTLREYARDAAFTTELLVGKANDQERTLVRHTEQLEEQKQVLDEHVKWLKERSEELDQIIDIVKESP